jgi:hypothetical protein
MKDLEAKEKEALAKKSNAEKQIQEMKREIEVK